MDPKGHVTQPCASQGPWETARFSAWGRARPRAVVTPAEDAGGVSGECRSLSSLLYPPPSRSAPATGTGSEAQGLGPTGVPGFVGEVQSPRARVRAWAQARLDLLNCQAAFRSGRPFPLPGRGLGRVACARLVCVPADAYRLPLLILASWWARLRFHHWSLREAGRWLVGWPRAGSWGGASCSRSGRPLGSAVRLSDVPRVHPCLDQCSGPVPRAPPPGPPGWGPASPTVCTSRSSTEWSLLHSHCPQGDQVPSFLF